MTDSQVISYLGRLVQTQEAQNKVLQEIRDALKDLAEAKRGR